jgi:hypothetical protein
VIESGPKDTDPAAPLDAAETALALIAGRISAPVETKPETPKPVEPALPEEQAALERDDAGQPAVEQVAAEATDAAEAGPAAAVEPTVFEQVSYSEPVSEPPDIDPPPELAASAPEAVEPVASEPEEASVEPQDFDPSLTENADAVFEPASVEPEAFEAEDAAAYEPVAPPVSVPMEPEPVQTAPEAVEPYDAEALDADAVDPQRERAESWPVASPSPEPPPIAAAAYAARAAAARPAGTLRPDPIAERPFAGERIGRRNPPEPEIDDERLDSRPPGTNRIVLGIAVLSILFGLGAIVASAWVYSEAQRDLRQLASDVAQLRVSLELFARQQTEAPDAGEVYARLMEIEQSVREAIASIPETTAPAMPPLGLGPSAQSDGDCLPPGTRFLVTTGDRYPVCGTQGVVEILSVGALDIALGDGSAVAIGGSTTLANTSCTVSVLSANADGMSGYGEIRVNC